MSLKTKTVTGYPDEIYYSISTGLNSTEVIPLAVISPNRERWTYDFIISPSELGRPIYVAITASNGATANGEYTFTMIYIDRPSSV